VYPALSEHRFSSHREPLLAAAQWKAQRSAKRRGAERLHSSFADQPSWHQPGAAARRITFNHGSKVKTIREHSHLVCAAGTRIRDALARLNTSSFLFQVVVDGGGMVVGTVTDGDVRRAILNGLALDDSVATCMQTQPVTGLVGDQEENLRKFDLIKGHVAFLPVTDKAGVLREIMVEEAQEFTIPNALVMAGGKGRRLEEHTRSTPKPLIPVGNKPLLEHVLDKLAEAKVQNTYVSVHHMGDQIEQFIAQRDSDSHIHVLRETSPLGTAGALSLLPRELETPVLVLNADVITQTDFAALRAFHDRHAYDATIGVTQHRVDIPFGLVRQDHDGRFAGIDEKPCVSYFVAAGIYYLSSEVTALVPPDTRMDMPELLNAARQISLSIGLFPIHEYWIDVGRPDDLDAANEAHANGT